MEKVEKVAKQTGDSKAKSKADSSANTYT